MTLLNSLGLVWMILFTGGLVLWGKAGVRKTFSKQEWIERAEGLSRRPVDIFMLGKVLLFLLGALGLVGLLTQFTRSWFPGPEGGAIAAGLVWQGGILYTGVCVLTFILSGRIEGGPQFLFGAEKGSFERTAPLGLAAYAMSLPISLALGLMYFGLLYLFGVDMEQQPVLDALLAMDSMIWVLLSFVFAAVAAPVVEEVLFRGLLLPYCLRKTGLWAGLFLSSLLFALIHGHAQTLFPLFVISVGFSLAYIWTGSIWVPIVMHGCFNFMNLLTGYIQNM